MIRKLGAALALAGALAAAPAAAAAFLVTLSGTVQASSPAGSPTPVTGLRFGTGDAFTGRWRVDLDAGTPFDVPIAGLAGLQRVYAFAVTQGRMRIVGAAGTTRFTQTAASRGAVLVVDNYAINPPFLIDEVAMLDGARYDGGLVETYAITGPVPSGVFLRNFSFGKILVGSTAAPPSLLTSLGRPDFAAMLAGGLPSVANFGVARGVPTSAAGISDLPTSNFSLLGPVFSVTAVPEPATWAMLVIGFGIIGAAMRRRAATPAGDATV